MVFLSQTSSLHNFMTNHRHSFISMYSSMLYALNSLFMFWLWLIAPFETFALNIAIASFESSRIKNRIKSMRFLATSHHRNHTCQTKQSFFWLADAFLPHDLQIHSPTHLTLYLQIAIVWIEWLVAHYSGNCNPHKYTFKCTTLNQYMNSICGPF